jgi:uncharacterized protein (TIGR00369 family)
MMRKEVVFGLLKDNSGFEILKLLVAKAIRSDYDDYLGHKFKEANEDSLVMELKIDKAVHFGPFSHVHGGVVDTFASSASAFTGLLKMRAGQINNKITTTINPTGTINPNGGPLVAKGKVMKSGRTLVSTFVEVSQDGKLMATATSQQQVLTLP